MAKAKARAKTRKTRPGARSRPAAARPPERVAKGREPLPAKAWVVLALAAAGAIACALILVSLLGSGDESKPRVTAAGTLAGAADVRRLFDGIPQDGTALGRPDAPVTLVEFADLQCPFCREWAGQTLPVLVRDYVRDGRLRIVFRPLAFIGDDSERAARYVVAAGNQGKLWQAVDLAYANQGGENSGWVSDAFLAALGRSIGVDPARAERDAASEAAGEELAKAEREADAAGVRSTPSFLLGKTGGDLRNVELTSLEPGGLTPKIDALLRG